MKIHIINGPNLNLLGTREPSTYGSQDFESYYASLLEQFPQVEFSCYQSNVEGEIIDALHRVGFDGGAVICNAGGYTHTSVAIGDAIAAIKSPVIEVHISNVYAREEYRHQSMLAKHCKGVIAGFGMQSYALAVQAYLEGPAV